MSMKKILLAFGVLAVAPTSLVADEINIHVTGIETHRGGVLTVMVFGQNGFPKKHAMALRTKTVPADKAEMDFSFTINRDHVAVKIHHDEDGNNKVTKNWTGIYPAEGLGFSNKQRVTFTGPPSYRKSKLVGADLIKPVKIKMRYGKKKKQ